MDIHIHYAYINPQKGLKINTIEKPMLLKQHSQKWEILGPLFIYGPYFLNLLVAEKHLAEL
jgi:hypothetical protein